MEAGQDGLPGHPALKTVKQELRGERELAPSRVQLMGVEIVRARILKRKNVTLSPVYQVYGTLIGLIN